MHWKSHLMPLAWILSEVNNTSMDDQSSFVVLNSIQNALLATVQVPLTSAVIERFKSDVLTRIKQEKFEHFLIDLSGLEIMDFGEYQEVCQVLGMVSLMGVSPVIVGLRPGVVASLVEHDIGDIHYLFALNIEDALNKINLSMD